MAGRDRQSSSTSRRSTRRRRVVARLTTDKRSRLKKTNRCPDRRVRCPRPARATYSWACPEPLRSAYALEPNRRAVWRDRSRRLWVHRARSSRRWPVSSRDGRCRAREHIGSRPLIALLVKQFRGSCGRVPATRLPAIHHRSVPSTENLAHNRCRLRRSARCWDVAKPRSLRPLVGTANVRCCCCRSSARPLQLPGAPARVDARGKPHPFHRGPVRTTSRNRQRCRWAVPQRHDLAIGL